MDIYAADDVIIEPGKSALVPTGLKMAIPYGYEVQIRLRSGISLKTPLRVPNAPGTIDCGYSGTIGCRIFNHSDSIAVFNRGDKVTQLVVMPCITDEVEIVDEIKAGDRGENGFGSTGA